MYGIMRGRRQRTVGLEIFDGHKLGVLGYPWEMGSVVGGKRFQRPTAKIERPRWEMEFDGFKKRCCWG